MALLTPFSIKWKLTLALILTGSALVGSYVYIAKNIFENDKISYVFDSQSNQVASLKIQLETQLDKTLSNSRNIISAFDFKNRKLNSFGEQLFNEDLSIAGLQLFNIKQKILLMNIDKPDIAKTYSPFFDLNVNESKDEDLSIYQNQPGVLIISLNYKDSSEVKYNLQIALLIDALIKNFSRSETYAVYQDNNLLFKSDRKDFPNDLFEKLSEINTPSNNQILTKVWPFKDERFLVSSVKLDINNIWIASITSEKEALGALSVLFQRSIVFLVLSFSLLIFISLSLSRQLTLNLNKLTEQAIEISHGNFSKDIKINSRDEIGVLAKAFDKMKIEILRLLVETKEKTRMEQELKTAKFVQEKLLPKLSTVQFGQIQVSGNVITSSECGGDWWYYFQRKEYLYVAIADATGHGTPAALITAAARSIFSRIEIEEMSLNDILNSWSIAIASCSQQELFMTGQIFKINTNNGEVKFVNAAHESPMYYKLDIDGGYKFENIPVDPSPRLGEKFEYSAPEMSFQMAPNETLVLYTDGLFSITRPDGKTLSEKRFGQRLAKRFSKINSALEVTNITLSEFEEFRSGVGLPDDISIVSIKRTDSCITQIIIEDSSNQIIESLDPKIS